MITLTRIQQFVQTHKIHSITVGLIVACLLGYGGWLTYVGRSSVASTSQHTKTDIKGASDDATTLAPVTDPKSSPESSTPNSTTTKTKKAQGQASTNNEYDFNFDKQSVSVLDVPGILSSPVVARASDPSQHVLWEITDNPLAKFGAGTIIYNGSTKNPQCYTDSTCTITIDPSWTPAGTYYIKLAARFLDGRPDAPPPNTPLTKALTVVVVPRPSFRLKLSSTYGGTFDNSYHIMNIPFTIDADPNYGFPITVKSGVMLASGELVPAYTHAYLTDQAHGVLVVEIYGNPSFGYHVVQLNASSRIGSDVATYSFEITE